MRLQFKKVVAVVSAFAMTVAGLAYTPSQTKANDGTWSIKEPTLVTYTVGSEKVYGIKNLEFTAYKGSSTMDYAYAAYVDSISEENLVRNYSADWLWGIGLGGNGLNYDGVVTNNVKSIYFTPGSTHKFIVAAYDKDDYSQILDTVEIDVNFPAGEIETTVEDRIKSDLKSANNIAIGKQSFSSSRAGAEFAASWVNDGDLGSRWAAETYKAGEFVGVNLGAIYSIDRVALIWEPAYASDYDIEVSTDGVNYTSIKNHKPATYEVKEFDFSGVQAQFVRVMCNAKSIDYGYSIYELGVFGSYVGEGIEVETTTEKPIEDGDDLIPASKRNSGIINVPACVEGMVEYAYEYKVIDVKISSEKWYVATFKVSSNVDKYFELRLQDSLNDYKDYSGIGRPQVFVPAGETRRVTQVFKGQADTIGGIFDVCMGYINATACDAAEVSIKGASLRVFGSEADALAAAATITDDVEEETTTAASEVEITTPAGEVESTTPSGEVESTTPSGEVESTTPAGEVESTTPAGEVESTTPAGEVESTTPAGEVESTTPAGEVESTTPAGEVESTTPSGEVESTTPAGEVESTTPSGEVESTTPASEVESTTPAGGNNNPTQAPTTQAPTTQAPTTTVAPTTVAPTTTAPATTAAVKLAKGKIAKASRAKNGKKVKLTFKKIKGATSYEIKISTSKKFKKGTKTYTSKKVSKTIKKLVASKKYYVKVRAVAIAKDGTITTGKWSKVKTIKVK